MPIIISIAIILFIFKGGFITLLGWLFNAVIAVFGFFANLFCNIATRWCQKTRKQLLRAIDKAYKEKDYRKVVSLYREVIKDHDYLNIEVMKYCHIAADAACKIAKTIPEYEEARSWPTIISFRDSYYKSETDALYNKITINGYEILKSQDELLDDAIEYTDSEEYDKAKKALKQAADNGSFIALMTLVEISVKTISSEEEIDTIKALMDRLDEIDVNLSSEYRKTFEETPLVKIHKHMENAKMYDAEAEKQQGIERERTMLKFIKEYEKIYDISPEPQIALYIARYYIHIMVERKKNFPESLHSQEKAIEYMKSAGKWLKKHGNEASQEYSEIEELIMEYMKILEKESNE